MVHPNQLDTSDIAYFMLHAGSSTIYSENEACNEGQLVPNNGVANCVVADARYIHLVSQATNTAVKFSEIYVLEEPDYASKHLGSIVTSNGTVAPGSKPLVDAIGLVSDLNNFGSVHI